MQIILCSSLSIAIICLFILPLNILGYIGIFLCFILSAAGTSKGILSISKYVSDHQ